MRLVILLIAGALWGGSKAVAQASSAPTTRPAPQALGILASNPYYFRDASGRPVVLIGDYTWWIFSDEDYDYKALFRSHQLQGLNQCRVWLWWGAEQFPQDTKYVVGRHIEPYLRSGPGTANDGRPKYDLSRFNPAFFERLRAVCAAARDRGVILQLITVDAWMLKHAHLWRLHAYQRDNNINGVDADPENTGRGTDGRRGFCSMGNPKAMEFQRAYVRALVDAVSGFENLYFEIANENYYCREWELQLCDFIKECEQGKPTRHLTMPRDLPSHSDVVQTWDPVMVHAGMLKRRELGQPLLFDTDWVINDQDDEVRKAMWSAVLSGGHFSYMDDSLEQFRANPGTDKRSPLHAQIGHLAEFMKQIRPWEMQPDEGVVRSGRAFAMVSTSGMVAYLPQGAAVSLDLARWPGPLACRWYNPREGGFGEESPIRGGRPLELKPPSTQDWALLFQRQPRE